jgi:hypothetical protein
VADLRSLRRAGRVGQFVSVAGGVGGVALACDGGRVCRPLVVCDAGVPRLTDAHVAAVRAGALTFGDLLKRGVVEFLDVNEERLDEEFGAKHEFQTSVRGLKVRGVFPSQKEAELRCKMLREVDPNHDVFVGPVGLWVPFHPEAYKTGRVEYMEDTLNQLMSDKKKNEEQAKSEFDKRVKEAKQKAIEENKRLAEQSGNKLTQTLNEQGELVGVSLVVGVVVSVSLGEGVVVRDSLEEGVQLLHWVSVPLPL